MTDPTTAPDEGPVTIQPAGEDPGHAIPTDTTTATTMRSVQKATERYEAAWLAHAEAHTKADRLARNAHVRGSFPAWQASLEKRTAVYLMLRFAQVQLLAALLAMGCTATEAAIRRADIERNCRRRQAEG